MENRPKKRQKGTGAENKEAKTPQTCTAVRAEVLLFSFVLLNSIPAGSKPGVTQENGKEKYKLSDHRRITSLLDGPVTKKKRRRK